MGRRGQYRRDLWEPASELVGGLVLQQALAMRGCRRWGLATRRGAMPCLVLSGAVVGRLGVEWVR